MASTASPRRVIASVTLACLLGSGLYVKSAMGLVPVKTNTTVVIAPLSPTTSTYSGKLTTKPAPKARGRERKAARRCLAGRRVGISSLGLTVANGVTDKKGNWSIAGAALAPGRDVNVLISRDVRRGVLCGVILKRALAP